MTLPQFSQYGKTFRPGIRKKSNVLLIFIFFCFFTQLSSSQIVQITGNVIDDNTGKSLAFVNISFNDSGKGTTSNIDGSFQISSSFQIYRLLFSYVGYKPVTLDILPNGKRTRLLIRLIPRSYSIREVEIVPGINPAHRIIDLVNQNRKYNDPEKIRSFS